MIISAYIMLAFFGLLTFLSTMKVIFGKGLYGSNVYLYMLSITIVALSSGIIWGGLFQ